MSSSICIFTHHYHPQLSGIGNFVDGLAHALAARGDRVVIVTNDSMRVGVGHSVENGLEIIRLPCITLLDGRLPLPKKPAIITGSCKALMIMSGTAYLSTRGFSPLTRRAEVCCGS